MTLTERSVPWAIATSSRLESSTGALATLGVPSGVPVITRDDVRAAKPDPDLFLAAAQALDVGSSSGQGPSGSMPTPPDMLAHLHEVGVRNRPGST